MLEEFDGYAGETAWTIQARVKDQVEKTLWAELNGGEDEDFVIDRTHDLMQNFEDCHED